VPAEKEQNGNEKKGDLNQSDLLHNSNEDTTESSNTKNQANQEKQNKFLWWSNFTKGEKTQIFLVIVNIVMVASFIVVSCNQIQNTNRIINLAEKNAKIELRAYLEIESFDFKQFIVGKEIIFEVKMTNVGKTPAYKIKRWVMLKPGGTGIYKSDFKDINEYEILAPTLGTTIPYLNIMNTKINLEQNDSIDIINGDKFFAVWGEFIYQDIFGEAQLTPFAFQYIARDSNFYIYNIKDD